MQDIRRGLWLMAIGIALFAGAQLLAEQPNAGNPETDERGCLCFWNGHKGVFGYNAFVKTADKKALADDGSSEIWGYNVEPGNFELMHEVKDGMVSPINARASIWIPADGRRHKVPIVPNPEKEMDYRWAKCPPYWSPQSNADASH